MKNVVNRLSKREKKMVLNCLHAAANGRFFPDWEFATLIGASRDEVRKVATKLDQTSTITDENWIITNCLNNLSGYPHDEFEYWHEHFDFTKAELLKILTKLLAK